MIEKDEVIKNILTILKEKVENADSLSRDIFLVHSGIIDSIFYVELILRLEDIYNIEIDFISDDFDTLTSINGLTNTVLELVNQE